MDKVEIIKKAIREELSRNERHAVMLRHFESMTYSEIGEVLGLTPYQAKQLYHTGLNKLIDVLRNREKKNGIS